LLELTGSAEHHRVSDGGDLERRRGRARRGSG
jgi:hypothetical protein